MPIFDFLKRQMFATLQKTLKAICFTLLMLINITINSAQSLSILSGISVPFNFYASKDVSLKDAGFANNGFCTTLRFEDTRAQRLVTLIAQFTYNKNNIDEIALEKFANSSTINKVNIQAINPWQQYFLGVGPKINLNQENFTLSAHGLIGINWLFSAAYNQFDSVNFIKQKQLNTNALGIMAGVGSRIKIANNIYFNLNLDAFYTSASYGNVVYTDVNGNILKTASVQKLEVPIQVFFVQAGLTFDLNKKSKKFIKN